MYSNELNKTYKMLKMNKKSAFLMTICVKGLIVQYSGLSLGPTNLALS